MSKQSQQKYQAERDYNWIKNWERPFRKKPIFILGGRAGTTLLHKCLLITGLVNWGTWSLHTYESEAPIKPLVWGKYPNIRDKKLIPKYKFEIAKSPEFGFLIDQIERIYHPIYIIMERDLIERVDSHIRAWDKGVMAIWEQFPNWKAQLTNALGVYPTDIKKLLIGYMIWRDELQNESLAKIPIMRKHYVDFHSLMDDWDYTMSHIADFCDIPTKNYREVWHELRKITLMPTDTDVKTYIK